MIRDLWAAWVRFCDEREDPLPLAMIRVFLGIVLLWDLALVGWYRLPVLLWGPQAAGGAGNPEALRGAWVIHQALSPEQALAWGPGLAWTLWATLVASLVAWTGGIATRASGLLFLLVYAQTALVNDTADRGIDRLVRMVVLVLLFSGAGRALSVDAWRSGDFWGTRSSVSAIPRALLVGQLVLVYACSGAEKFAISWFPWGGYSALYIILQDPMLAVRDHAFLGAPGLYWVTQVGTAVTHAWEWTILVLPWVYWFRATRERPGRLRALCNALDVRTGYVIVGVFFHLSLYLTLHLGIFPWAMLAMYPAFYSGPEVRSLAWWLRAPGARVAG